MADERLECPQNVCVPDPAGAASGGAEVVQQRLLADITHLDSVLGSVRFGSVK